MNIRRLPSTRAGDPALPPTAFKAASPQGLLLLLPAQPCPCLLLLLVPPHLTFCWPSSITAAVTPKAKACAKATMGKIPKEHQAALHWEAAAEGHTLKSLHNRVLSLLFHVTLCEQEGGNKTSRGPFSYLLIFFIYFNFKQGNETISEVTKQVPVVIRMN